MRPDDGFDRILCRADEITPSATFVNEVMDAIHREARSMPPLAFPWKRAIPGICATFGSLTWLMASSVIEAIREPGAVSSPNLGAWSFFSTLNAMDVAWIAFALVPSLIVFKLLTRPKLP